MSAYDPCDLCTVPLGMAKRGREELRDAIVEYIRGCAETYEDYGEEDRFRPLYMRGGHADKASILQSIADAIEDAPELQP